MQFTTVALAALSIASSALAASTTVHVVKVGNSNGTLAFSPNNVTAAVGDMVQFQFAPANHSVAQSTFDQPCAPVSQNSNVTGIFSGFMPVKATDTEVPTYTVLINNTTPMWIYCAQAKHCQSGMVMVINEAPSKNATRTLANYAALAAKASANIAPGSAIGGTTSETSSGSTTTSSSGSSSTGSSSNTTTSSSGATSIKPSEALTLGGLLALGMAMLV